jgi:predicted short-subunit dehydrogenase-like oxidoreductase (DUF2520 family)
MTRVFVWGAGQCGQSLARALHNAGHSVVGAWTRSPARAQQLSNMPWPTASGDTAPPSLADAEVVWITVVDDAIAAAASIVGRHQIALHASGALPAAVLRSEAADPRSVASCHPLQSFTEGVDGAERIRGSCFGIEGEDDGVAMAKALVESMGADAFVVADETAKALYHAACCVASNALVALADRAVNLFSAAGVSRAQALKALSPLIQGTAENLAGTDAAARVLTGPIARGDAQVIERHLKAIAERAPQELESYRRLAEEILRLAPNADIAKQIDPEKSP